MQASRELLVLPNAFFKLHDAIHYNILPLTARIGLVDDSEDRPLLLIHLGLEGDGDEPYSPWIDIPGN